MILNVASDIETRQLVWVSRSQKTGKQFTYQGEIKAFPAYELAGLATNYKGRKDKTN